MICLFSFIGKVTSLVAKRDHVLATRIEEAIRKNESLESVTVDSVRRDIARAQITDQKGRNAKLIKVPRSKNNTKGDSVKSSRVPSKAVGVKSKKASVPAKTAKGGGIRASKPVKLSSASSSRKPSFGRKKLDSKKSSVEKSTDSKLNVVGFRGRSSWSNKKEKLMSR